MSKVTSQAVRHTASLARLDLAFGLSETDAQAAMNKFAEQFDNILASMDVLSELDTSGVEPMYSPVYNVAPPREDVPRVSPGPDKVLGSAPDRHEDFFVVPAIL